MMSTPRLFTIFLLVIAGSLSAPGCGGSSKPKSPTGKVEGTVSFKGQPAVEGTVRFHPDGGKGSPVMAALGADGTFKVSEPVQVGNYKVYVTPPPEPPPQAGVKYEPKQYPNIPPKYRSELSTPFTAEVKTGDNKFSFDMLP